LTFWVLESDEELTKEVKIRKDFYLGEASQRIP